MNDWIKNNTHYRDTWEESLQATRQMRLVEFLKLIKMADYDFGRFEDLRDLGRKNISGVEGRYIVLNEWIERLERE